MDRFSMINKLVRKVLIPYLSQVMKMKLEKYFIDMEECFYILLGKKENRK